MPGRFPAQVTRLELIATIAASKAAMADLFDRMSELDAGLRRLPSDDPRAVSLAELRATVTSDARALQAAVAEAVAALAAMECS